MAQVQGLVEPFVAPTPVIVAATPAAATTFFVAPQACTVATINYIYSVISTSGTLAIKKDAGTQAPGAGNVITVAATVNVGTGGPVANTYTNVALSATAADLALAAGDRLSFTPAGTLTGLAGCILNVTLQ